MVIIPNVRSAVKSITKFKKNGTGNGLAIFIKQNLGGI